MKQNMSIYYVDDDEDDRQLFMETVLEIDPAIDCKCASNGQEALSYLANIDNEPPDLIFLDLRMAGLSGQKCLVEMKKIPSLLAVPVIVYTTSRDVKDSIRLKEMGAAHFMSKPTSAEEVYFMLSFVLGEKWK